MLPGRFAIEFSGARFRGPARRHPWQKDARAAIAVAFDRDFGGLEELHITFANPPTSSAVPALQVPDIARGVFLAKPRGRPTTTRGDRRTRACLCSRRTGSTLSIHATLSCSGAARGETLDLVLDRFQTAFDWVRNGNFAFAPCRLFESSVQGSQTLRRRE